MIHCEKNILFAGFECSFIFLMMCGIAKPTERSFDAPLFWQNDEYFHIIGAFDHFNGYSCFGYDGVDDTPCIHRRPTRVSALDILDVIPGEREPIHHDLARTPLLWGFVWDGVSCVGRLVRVGHRSRGRTLSRCLSKVWMVRMSVSDSSGWRSGG